MVLFKNHSQYTWKPRQQQRQNKYEPQFQGYQGNTLSFKSSITKQNFLELPSVLQCKRRKDMTYKFVMLLDRKELKIVWKKKHFLNDAFQSYYDLFNCFGPESQRGAVMVDNQHENLHWKISVNSTP